MTDPNPNQVHSVTFSPEGVALTYMRMPIDVRKNGLLWQHQVQVPLGSDYDDELEALLLAAQALLADVLEDEETAEAIEPDIEEDEEEEDD